MLNGIFEKVEGEGLLPLDLFRKFQKATLSSIAFDKGRSPPLIKGNSRKLRFLPLPLIFDRQIPTRVPKFNKLIGRYPLECPFHKIWSSVARVGAHFSVKSASTAQQLCKTGTFL